MIQNLLADVFISNNASNISNDRPLVSGKQKKQTIAQASPVPRKINPVLAPRLASSLFTRYGIAMDQAMLISETVKATIEVVLARNRGDEISPTIAHPTAPTDE